MRVEDAFPAIVSQQEFRRIVRSLRSKAPARVSPRRASSPYLLSGLVKCEKCGKALTAAEAKSGKYSYYVCHSLLKKGKGTCKTPRLNSKRFEKLMIDQIRANILMESNIRDLVRLMDEEMDGVAAEQRERLETSKRSLSRCGGAWTECGTSSRTRNSTYPTPPPASESTGSVRRSWRSPQRRPVLSERRAVLDNVDTIAAFAEDMSEFLMTSEITESRAFVKEIKVKPGKATVYYTLPEPAVPEGYTAESYLRRLCSEAALRRYGSMSEKVEERLEEEFRLIKRHRLAGFLLHREVVLIAQQITEEKGMAHPEIPLEERPPGRGRGSSVALLVGYLIGFSHVDPLRWNLALERFTSEDTFQLPDIDLDFPRGLRDELIQRVHEHFGPDYAVLAGAIATYSVKGIIQDLARPWGCPKRT